MQSERDAERLLEVVAEVVREAHPRAQVQVELDSSLDRDLGLDSLSRVELMFRLETAFGVSLPEQALASAETPRDLLRFLLGSIGSPPQSADHSVASLSRSPSVAAPERARTLVEAFEWHVERQPERLTVHMYEDAHEHQLSYGALYERALGYAARLVDAGMGPGQTVAIMLPTCREYLYCFYAILLAGAIPVPLYPPARLAQVEDHLRRHVGILKSAGAALLVTIPEAKPLAYLLRAHVHSLHAVLTPAELEGAAGGFLPVRGRPGDIAFLQYTSGSTGNPKGVVLTHDNLLANIRAMGKAAQATADDVFVSWLPLYHDMGLIGGCFTTLYFGFPVVLMSPLAFLVRPSQWLRAIQRHRGSISGGPNFAYELCLRRVSAEEIDGLDLSSWRFAFNGAEPVSPETLGAFEQRFSAYGLRKNALAPVYGLAECSVGLAFTPPGEPWKIDVIDREAFVHTAEARPARAGDPSPLRYVCCGCVLPGHDLRVVDVAGLELPERHEGLLQFRGPSATSGYYRNPEQTRTLFDGEWLNTGDRAYLSEGRLYITGREKDIIIQGGRNISPYEIEEAVGDLAGVRRGCVAVFGSHHAASGTERVVVLAETREADEAALEQLRRQINERVIDLIGMPPDDVVLAPAHTVPKTSSGKIRRAAAREYYEAGPSAVRRAPVWWQFVRLAAAAAAPQLRRTLRALGGAVFAARAWLVFGLIFPAVFVAAAAVPGKRTWSFGQRCARLFFRAAGIPVVARGLERLPARAPFIIACNHTSYLDALILLSLLDWRNYAFIAKREFLDSFAMRVLLSGFGTQFVERFDTQKSAEEVTGLLHAAKNGVSLIAFPEGTLTRFTGLMPFRAGAFQVAAQAGVPVVPVALRGVRSVLRDGTWLPRRAPVLVTVGDPVFPKGNDWNAAVALRDRVRGEILEGCGEPDLAVPGSLG